MRFLPFFFFFILAFARLQAQTEQQGSSFAPLHDDNHYWTDYEQIRRSDFRHLHSHIQPLLRSEVAKMAQEGDTLSALPAHAREYLQRDNVEFFADSLPSRRPFLKYLYRSPAFLYEFSSDALSFKINPMLDATVGMQRLSTGENALLYTNMRGVQVRGNIARRIHFYSEILETQSLLPLYAQQFVEQHEAVPSAGFFKSFQSRFMPNQQGGGVDYLLASGYISFKLAKIVNVQFGNGRNFWGDGIRSLFLSDFSNNYTFLKINTHYKFLNYTNLFAELVADHTPRANVRVPRKFMAAHLLSINLRKNLNLTLFESVMYGARNGLELSYLNPIIFYRAAEQQLGSPDNAIVGASMKYNFLRHFSIYGQIIFDEFVFNELFIRRAGWWGNKYGVQLGARYVDAFTVPQLSLQAEWNRVRPYVYTFIDSTANYTHYNQPTAHPLGANFNEIILSATYAGVPRLWLQAQCYLIRRGIDDTTGSNWGSDLRQSYTTRPFEDGHVTGQGLAENIVFLNAQARYSLRHNLHLGAQYLYRRSQSELPSHNFSSHIFTLSLRYQFVPQGAVF